MVDRVVTHWGCGLLMACKCCEGNEHSQSCVGDVAKDWARWEQDVGAAQVSAYGLKSAAFQGNVID